APPAARPGLRAPRSGSKDPRSCRAKTPRCRHPDPGSRCGSILLAKCRAPRAQARACSACPRCHKALWPKAGVPRPRARHGSAPRNRGRPSRTSKKARTRRHPEGCAPSTRSRSQRSIPSRRIGPIPFRRKMRPKALEALRAPAPGLDPAELALARLLAYAPRAPELGHGKTQVAHPAQPFGARRLATDQHHVLIRGQLHEQPLEVPAHLAHGLRGLKTRLSARDLGVAEG